MKFLSKKPNSKILEDGIIYKAKDANNNRRLLQMLLEEQHFFCAYTEKYILTDEDLNFPESVDIEHFTSTKKGTVEDDYFNWYAVLHKVNIKKLDEKYTLSEFHITLFFQNRAKLDSRIEYDVEDNLYYETDANDIEAREFIEFIQINSPMITNRRKSHLNKLNSIFQAKNSKESFADYLLNHKQDLSFITAIEQKFDIDLESHL